MNFKKSLYSCNTKRCVAKEALLRTFCSFLAQGLGGWCAGLVWDGADGRKNAFAQDGMEGGVVEHLTNRIFGKRRVVA